MNKHMTCLIPLCLTACQTTHVSSQPDALSLVDQLLGAQLVKIQIEQKSLALASGLNFQPLKTSQPVTVQKAQLTPLVKSIPEPKGLLSKPGIVNSQPAIIPNVSFTGEADNLPALVSKAGNNQSLDNALVVIIPSGWTTVKSARLTSGFKKPVSWAAGDQWPHTMSKLALENKLRVQILWASRQVLIDVADSPKVNKPVALTPLAQPKLLSPPSIANKAATPDKAKPTPLIVPKVSVLKAPSPLPQPVKNLWRAETGTTLKDAIFTWAAETTCEANPDKKWTVAWVTTTNYRIDAPLQFSGTWRDALNQVFTLYLKASVPLYAGTNTAQCVLKVDDKPVVDDKTVR
ncbi:TPA: TcpQ domain-containing protein [Enterobacter cancerogenus]|nr:TcpQ domain-containing protein [Enterobacter cancerogenus]